MAYYGQKQTFNRNIQKTIEDINQLLTNSKLASKCDPSEPIFTYFELLSVLKHNLSLILDKIVDDLNFEVPEDKKLIRGSESTFEVLVQSVLKGLEKLVSVQLNRMETFT